MTVSSTQIRVSYSTDGSTVSFPIPFPFYLSTDLLVYLAGTQISTGFSISGGNGSTGTLISVSPWSPNQALQIILNVPLTQLVNLVDGTAFPSDTLNQVNDRAIQAALRLSDRVSRTVSAPDGDASPGMLLPPAASRAGKYLGFDSFGNITPITALPGTNNTQQSLGPILNPQTPAEATAGVTPTNFAYAPYNAFRYMTGAQIADVQARTLSVDVTTALQNCLNAGIRAQELIVLPAGSYLISSRLTGGSNIRLWGDARDSTLIYYNGANTIPNGDLLGFINQHAFSIQHIGFRCGNIVSGNASNLLHLQDCVNFDLANLTFGGGQIAATGCALTMCLIDQSTNGFVPPRGNGRLANFLAVLSPTNIALANSFGVHISGFSTQSMQNISLEGEASIEHFNFQLTIENATSVVVGAGWEFRGGAQPNDTCIRLKNAANCVVMGSSIIPAPTTGTGISLDSNCADNIIIDPAWNFSSGQPAAAITDNGNRTTVIGQGAPGSLTFAGKLPGGWVMSGKPDGFVPNLNIIKSNTDTTMSTFLLTSGGAALASPAWRGIAAGNNVGAMDIDRIEVGTVLKERCDANGTRYLSAGSASPGGAALANSQVTFYLDEVGNNLKVLVKYSNGTVKTGTLALV